MVSRGFDAQILAGNYVNPAWEPKDISRPNIAIYKTLNWPEYSRVLKFRGSLTFWFDPEVTWVAAPTGKRGRQPFYSGRVIQTCLTMKFLFGMALRQMTGLVEMDITCFA